MRKWLLLIGILALTSTSSAADLKCWGTIMGRGYSAADRYDLTPMKEDAYMLIAKKDQFSFVVDTIDLKTQNSLRLFCSRRESGLHGDDGRSDEADGVGPRASPSANHRVRIGRSDDGVTDLSELIFF